MKRRLSAGLAAIAVTAMLAACSGGATEPDGSGAAGDGDGDRVTVRVGVTDEAQDYWATFIDLAADEGIDVELENFTDYTQPNPILSQGQLDLNQFQHLYFLANYNVTADDDLQPVGSTAIYQLGLYTEKGYASPDDIPEGAKIAIPNDPVNQARALLVLQSAGLVTLADGGNAFSTPLDVQDGSRVEVVPVDANQTVVQLHSLDGAVINNNFVNDAGIDPTSAIYSDLDDPDAARPYVNLWVARAEDKDNPTYQKLVEIYQRPEVMDQVLEANGGTAIAQDIPAEELQQDLADLEELVRQNS